MSLMRIATSESLGTHAVHDVKGFGCLVAWMLWQVPMFKGSDVYGLQGLQVDFF